MTFLSPTFRVSELRVYQQGHQAFSCKFHKGVNVLRGRNSSGKTTIMDLLAYALGAENIPWKPEALLCTETLAEVYLNDIPVCFKRELVANESQKPISFYMGEIESALKSAPNEWQKHPFKRSEKSFSFSQVIFNALGMPLAQGDGASILTMHQILRVLYADQPSLHSPIFRMDSFDKALTRETVGDYLCGIYDDGLYTSQIRLKQVDVDLTKSVSELKSIFKVLGRSGQSENIHFIDSRIQELKELKEKLLSKLNDIKLGQNLDAEHLQSDKNKTEELRKSLNKSKSLELKNRDEIDQLTFDIADSEMFIIELESRLRNLNESGKAREYFNGIQFQFCPSCLSDLHSEDTSCCHLCKSALNNDNGAPNLLRMRNEIAVQLKESKFLLEHKNKTLQELKKNSPALKKDVKRLTEEYNSVSKNWQPTYEIEFERVSRELGKVDAEIDQAYEHQKLNSVIEELQRSRDSLQSEKERLESHINSLVSKEESLKHDISYEIESTTIRLLKQDLHLQAEFIDPKQVKFSFEDNTVYVNGSKNFSESSAVILRHLFHLALLTASLKKPYMRLPRFMMLDGIDDGGMEKGRSHNLQKIIVEETSTYEHDFQLIFATSEINPDFEDTELTVGRYYNPSSRSLDVRYIGITPTLLDRA
ncbi:AAA family ATPase [Salmonella enterica subsp. salamae]|nr:AAA family ATPase [Salmonella enterica subsp. salamae]ECI4077642.1 AAA family ATPase [Salmonella enterica subsp. salamae]